jgi:hypothetical protein
VRGNPQAGYFGLPIERYPYFIHKKRDPDPYHFTDNGWLLNISFYHHPGIAKCLADDPSATELECATVPRFYPYTTTPMFISENTADSYQVYAQGECPSGSEAAGPVSFIRYLRGVLAGSLHSNVIQGKKAATDGLYAPACLAHCLQWNRAQDGGKAPTVSGKSHQQAMGDWYFGRGGQGQHFLINDDDSVDALVSCTDQTSRMNAAQLKVRHYRN